MQVGWLALNPTVGQMGHEVVGDWPGENFYLGLFQQETVCAEAQV